MKNHINLKRMKYYKYKKDNQDCAKQAKMQII